MGESGEAPSAPIQTGGAHVKAGPAPIAVTGIGVVSALGVGRRAFWSALAEGRSGIAPVEGLARPSGLPAIAAPVLDFKARELITSAHYRRMDKLSRMVVAASRLALDDAGISLDRVAPEDVGVVYGSALGDMSESVQHLERIFTRGPAAASPMVFPNLVLNAPASYVSMELGFTGVNLTISQAEVSGEEAITLGAALLRAGRAEIVLAGGGDELSDMVIAAAHRARALAGQRGGREWMSPYDRGRTGIVLGEGAAMLLLEPLERAQARGATVYACLAGEASFAVPAPAYDWPDRVDTPPAALRRLVDPAAVQLVCGGANASPRLDACELGLVADLLPSPAAVQLTSIKGAIGEFGAAGALTVAAACLALHAQAAPPLCNVQDPAPTALRLAGARATPLAIERALVCGLARGGAGSALLLARA